MGCGCAGSQRRTAPAQRDRRAKESGSPPSGGSAQGAMGKPGYYYTGPEKPPATKD